MKYLEYFLFALLIYSIYYAILNLVNNNNKGDHHQWQTIVRNASVKKNCSEKPNSANRVNIRSPAAIAAWTMGVRATEILVMYHMTDFRIPKKLPLKPKFLMLKMKKIGKTKMVVCIEV
jgi:hypothetical protein